MQKSIPQGFEVSTILEREKVCVCSYNETLISLLLNPCRVDNDESDEYCPYCDNHYVLPAVEPDQQQQEIELSELMKQQLMMQFGDSRMKAKFADLDEEFEALLQEQ